MGEWIAGKQDEPALNSKMTISGHFVPKYAIAIHNVIKSDFQLSKMAAALQQQPFCEMK